MTTFTTMTNRIYFRRRTVARIMSHINGVLDVSIDVVLVAMTLWLWCHPQCAPMSRSGMVIIVELQRVTWKNWQYMIQWKVTTYMTRHNSAGGLCFVQQLQTPQPMGATTINGWDLPELCITPNTQIPKCPYSIKDSLLTEPRSWLYSCHCYF